MSVPRLLRVCLVGAGPRGLSVLERICAHERRSPSHSAVTVHVVDPYPPGAGKVWRTAQSPLLLMNTVASQVTVFTDGSVDMEGPVEPGPSLYEWVRARVRAERADASPDDTYGGSSGGSSEGPSADAGTDAAEATDAADAVRAEARKLGPDSYPSRALYGRYLEDVYRNVVAEAPAHLTVVEHRTSATALDDTREGPHRTQALTLADGTRLDGLDAVVLAQGHVPARPTEREEQLTREATDHGLTYVLPANPADLDLSAVAPGSPVLLRGLGLNFFDHLALLTVGRGGTFERSGGKLVYRASGREPRICAGSRRGIPYHARGENEKGAHGRYLPRLLRGGTVERLRARAAGGERVHFGADLWPLIAKEVESVYYETLLASRQEAGADTAYGDTHRFVRRYMAASGSEAERRVLDEWGIAAADRWDWDSIARPYGDRPFTDRASFNTWLLDHLAGDVTDARAGNVSGPLKAALDVLRDLRNEIRLAVDHGGLEGNSYRDDLQGWYTPLNAFLSIGPPVSRIEQLLALIDAGTVELMGPDLKIDTDTSTGTDSGTGTGTGTGIGTGIGTDTGTDTAGPAFVATSRRVGGEPVRATVLIEARLPEPDIRRTADPLLRHLVATGQAVPYRIDGACGTSYETGGLAVTPRPYRTVDAHGHAHPRRFAYGVPTESVHWVTAAGIRPGVNSVTLGDSDAIARAVLAPPAGQESQSREAEAREDAGRDRLSTVLPA
ncbi:FAD/NAD(P)-binding protein [Streptomyces iconiensis]|uniref:FAD/NAD(P)-binding protein n=1 Tax=Streptomyces iconiensis TaxID=1384038 RepID=A0ABT7A0D5_9ACTN|nr:FAD/NAD(P)-binding protein [Streptomyces iconiensis]MDJ1134790.1 FAD/NAD(P)-binding protein [Streptomyces iconiensis]